MIWNETRVHTCKTHHAQCSRWASSNHTVPPNSPPVKCSVELKQLQLFITLSELKTFLTYLIQPASLCLVHVFDLWCWSGEAGYFSLVLLGHRPQPLPSYLNQIRKKSHTFAITEHVVCTPACLHTQAHTQIHTSAFFIIILELIGSNYLPCLWLVSL